MRGSAQRMDTVTWGRSRGKRAIRSGTETDSEGTRKDVLQAFRRKGHRFEGTGGLHAGAFGGDQVNEKALVASFGATIIER